MRNYYTTYYDVGQQVRVVWPHLLASDPRPAIRRGELAVVIGIVHQVGGDEFYQVQAADGRMCWCDPHDLDLPLISIEEDEC